MKLRLSIVVLGVALGLSARYVVDFFSGPVRPPAPAAAVAAPK